MKKIILTVAAMFAFGMANAQDIKSSKGENYLPEAGDWAIGFNADGVFKYAGNSFNGTSGNAAPSVTYQNAGTFVGKKFISAKEAYRVVANFAVASNENPGGYAANGTTYDKQSGFDLTAGLGKEWRKGKTRLQGFYGADAMLGFSSMKYSNKVGDGSYEPGTTFKIGVNGFIGAEYFIFPKMSIGAQYTYGLNIGVRSESKVDGNGRDDKSTNIGLGGVQVGSINLTLHF